jgi:hypothetical protein
MKVFSVSGPFDVHLEPNKGGKMVAKDLDAFWEEVGEHRHDVGVYVFAIRAGKGFTPIYVGKTARQSFENEVFTVTNRAHHYNPALLNYTKGVPVLLLIVHPRGKGKINHKAIDQVETFFIDVASIKNPGLSNVQKKKQHKWRVSGVVRAKPGEGTAHAARELKRAVGL